MYQVKTTNNDQVRIEVYDSWQEALVDFNKQCETNNVQKRRLSTNHYKAGYFPGVTLEVKEWRAEL
jgi:hypothetical protein